VALRQNVSRSPCLKAFQTTFSKFVPNDDTFSANSVVLSLRFVEVKQEIWRSSVNGEPGNVTNMLNVESLQTITSSTMIVTVDDDGGAGTLSLSNGHHTTGGGTYENGKCKYGFFRYFTPVWC